jgi:Asp-tRNA(Asn)/Glu-tRNA(Gln) amidotransferase A subunit family amidase
LVGREFDEGKLLKMADAFQSQTTWHQKRPAL